jgi:hypothetical protein
VAIVVPIRVLAHGEGLEIPAYAYRGIRGLLICARRCRPT